MKLTEIMQESEASEEAKKRGLVSKGWGNWADKTGEVVAKTVDGKLRYIFQNEPRDHHKTHSATYGATNIVRNEPKFVNLAATAAIKAHGDQQYGDMPYSYHLRKVYDNAVRFGGTAESRVAAILHDTLEDTQMTKQEIASQFGPRVAEIVDLVTNQSTKEETYRRIASNDEAVFVKLCDRLANVSEGGKLDMYRKQHPLFKQMLYTKGQYESLWRAIDKALATEG